MDGDFAMPRPRSARARPAEQSLEAVTAETLPVIFASMCYRIGDRDVAADLTQETYTEAAKSWHTFKPGSDPLPWLFTIGRTVRARYFQARNEEAQLRKRLESLHDVGFDGLEIQGLPDVFKRLSHEDQEVLFLSVIAGLKVKDIARHLDIQRSACSMRIQRALERLHQLMEGDFDV